MDDAENIENIKPLHVYAYPSNNQIISIPLNPIEEKLMVLEQFSRTPTILKYNILDTIEIIKEDILEYLQNIDQWQQKKYYLLAIFYSYVISKSLNLTLYRLYSNHVANIKFDYTQIQELISIINILQTTTRKINKLTQNLSAFLLCLEYSKEINVYLALKYAKSLNITYKTASYYLLTWREKIKLSSTQTDKLKWIYAYFELSTIDFPRILNAFSKQRIPQDLRLELILQNYENIIESNKPVTGALSSSDTILFACYVLKYFNKSADEIREAGKKFTNIKFSLNLTICPDDEPISFVDMSICDLINLQIPKLKSLSKEHRLMIAKIISEHSGDNSKEFFTELHHWLNLEEINIRNRLDPVNNRFLMFSYKEKITYVTDLTLIPQ